MADRMVGDASLVAKWVVNEHDAEIARELIRHWQRDGVEIHGPPHTLVEVAGVIRRHQWMGELDLAGARRAMMEILTLDIQLHDEPSLYDRALDLSDQFGRSIPDAMYLAVAEQLGCELWTADAVLVTAVQPALPWVKLLR